MNETDTTETDTIGTDTKGAGDRPRLIRRHDQFAKQLLDQKGLADVFLRERLPAALTARLTPEPASDRSESFVDATLAERRGDRVYSLALADGPQVLAWTMIEHKSAPDPDSILQTLGYVTGLATRAATRIEMPNGSLCLIPAPVFAVILYHGDRPWPLPTVLGPAYRLPPDMASIGLLDFNLLEPGGVLIYETFARGNERFGRPSSPAFLLDLGELLETVRNRLQVVAFEHGEIDMPKKAVVQRLCAVSDRITHSLV